MSDRNRHHKPDGLEIALGVVICVLVLVVFRVAIWFTTE